MENKKNSDISMSQQDIRRKKAQAYTMLLVKQSDLFNTLDRLSTLSEEKLTKKDLYSLIAKACSYMKAKSIYDYWCHCFREEILKDKD